MVVPASFDEIGREYLDRKYMVYVRQSPGVAGNHESGLELQYQLKKRGLELGWEEEKIHIVDDDQGTSGGSTFGRDGFKKMLAEVILGNVGAIGCTEVSRLARDSSDFQYLLKACAMTDTLIIDLYRIYRLSDEDTQLLLGIKGMMAELERRFIKTRMYSAKLNKASKGELRLPLPVGLVYDHKGNIILDPDEEIQRSILLVFSVVIPFARRRQS
jgi:DNA invertase Pin-like site-specific DNA recombinase